jgi:hypothetical protein
MLRLGKNCTRRCRRETGDLSRRGIGISGRRLSKIWSRFEFPVPPVCGELLTLGKSVIRHTQVYTPVASWRRAGNSAGRFLFQSTNMQCHKRNQSRMRLPSIYLGAHLLDHDQKAGCVEQPRHY